MTSEAYALTAPIADSKATYATYITTFNDCKSKASTFSDAINVSILRNATIEPLIPVLGCECAALDRMPNFSIGEYDNVMQDALDPSSTIYSQNPDLVIMFQWLETLAPHFTTNSLSLSEEDSLAAIVEVTNLISMQLGAIRKNTDSPVLVNNFPEIYRHTAGILTAQKSHARFNFIQTLNDKLSDVVASHPNSFIVDLRGIFARLGSRSAFDERNWFLHKNPLSQEALIELGREYGRFLRALNGRARKCLVLDCDNTLWGGVVGESGLQGIKLSQDFPGNSFMAFQDEIKSLYYRGVILALCSKNNEEDVMEVFENHPNMVLKKQHIAAHQINWNDKAENIIKIAEELNIGLNSIVFADDSDFECNRVREALPDVTILHLNDKPTTFRRRLAEAGLFDALSYSNEDHKRTQTYQSNKKRKKLKESVGSVEDYLMGLEITAKIEPIEENLIPRVSQLTQKTNQFSLTTRRYTESDIANFVAAPDHYVLHLSFADRFSDFGTVGAAIVKREDNIAVIDTLLMSCRALGRDLEVAMISYIQRVARDWGCHTLVGTYLPTKKNAQVAEFYPKYSFQITQKSAEEVQWSYNLASESTKDAKIPAWIMLM